jgi:sterol desaturase/sphingolipid hydroxylase (fatty acid hydroxylase superfamily)
MVRVMPVVAIVFGVAFVMMIIEALRPGRTWKKVSGWWARAVFLNLIQVASVFVGAYTWDAWFAGGSLWQAEQTFGVTGGAVLGYFVITFIYYWWHRWRHENDFLWRNLHQLHHSPQRIEIITAFYKHPLEIVVNGALSSFILYVLVGLGPQASSLAVLLTGLGELVYHWNVKTPYWLGFIFQRPESHCVHHRHGWHRQNFSDLPLWDMLFGTFHNPKEFDDRCGFDSEREARLGEMLLGHDVHRRS